MLTLHRDQRKIALVAQRELYNSEVSGTGSGRKFILRFRVTGGCRYVELYSRRC